MTDQERQEVIAAVHAMLEPTDKEPVVKGFYKVGEADVFGFSLGSDSPTLGPVRNACVMKADCSAPELIRRARFGLRGLRSWAADIRGEKAA